MIRLNCIRPDCTREAAMGIENENLCTVHVVLDHDKKLSELNTLISALKPPASKTSAWSWSIGFVGLVILGVVAPFFIGAAWGLVVVGYRWCAMLGPG